MLSLEEQAAQILASMGFCNPPNPEAPLQQQEKPPAQNTPPQAYQQPSLTVNNNTIY